MSSFARAVENRMEEGSLGSGAGLCATGTQARAPPKAAVRLSHHSNIPIFHHSNESK